MKRIVFAILLLGLPVSWMLRPPAGLTHVTTTNTVLFDREIVRILDVHCVGCHSARGLASPLVTYEQTWLNRGAILSSVLSGHMPPWAAVAGYRDFANENGLTLREIQFVTSWVEGLGPRNAGEVFLNVRDPTEALAAVEAGGRLDAWVLGEPDLIQELDATTVEPEDRAHVERIVLDLGLLSERRVHGIEFIPGDRRVVRAANFLVEETGQWLGSWTPWHGSASLPAGAAHHLAAGTRLLAEIHYGASDERVIDEGRLGLFFADEPSAAVAQTSDLVLEAGGDVPPFTAMEGFGAESPLEDETRILALLPRFEPGIRSLEVSVRRPDGGTDILLFAKDIPLEWPTPYVLEEPVVAPSGSVLRATAYYENPTDMPRAGGFSLTVSRF